MDDELWGPVDPDKWRRIATTSGTLATEEDVKAGCAVFYLENPDEIGAEPYEVNLPHCGVLTDDESGKEIPVIVIQAEQAEDMIYVGYRFLGGGNEVCTLSEIELLNEPDPRFCMAQ
jgi:hypothetical protein